MSQVEHTGHGAFGGLLDGGDNLLVFSGLGQAHSQIDNGDIGGGDAEGHAGQLTVELGDNLAHGLGGASGGGDNVARRATTGAPVLATARGTIDAQLVGGHGVNGGHQTLLDAPLVIDNLGQRSQAVGGARGVGGDLDVGSVLVMVDTHHEHGGVSRGSRDDDL